MESMFEVTEGWKIAFPGAHAGVLVMKNVINPASHAGLERRKEELVDAIAFKLRQAGAQPAGKPSQPAGL